MTLNTSVVIGKPYNVQEIFDFCRRLIDTPEGTPTRSGQAADDNSGRYGQKWLLNPPNIGLCAWLWVYYGADGPMVHKCDEYCSLAVDIETSQEDVDEHTRYVTKTPTQNGWAAIEITFDTTYGYQGDDGESCSDLHARLVTALGRWLEDKKLPWKWQNEFTGEWHDGFDGLKEFGNAFKATGAKAWFENVVKPAIANRAG